MTAREQVLDTTQRAGDAVGTQTAREGRGTPVSAWSAGWSASVQRPSIGFEENWSETGFADQSVRQTVRVTSSGTAARIRLSNRYGERPLRIAGATLALAGEGKDGVVQPGTLRQLTFGGKAEVTIPAGGEVVSDEAAIVVDRFASLTVSLHFAEASGPVTFHAQAYASSHRATGNHIADLDGAAYTEHTNSWYVLSDIELTGGPEEPQTVVAFGDSITDGFGSTGDTDRRYPDALAERLAAAGVPYAVLNAGIGGNLVLNDSLWFGEAAPARFERDVLDKPGVRSVIVLAGLNDIGFSEIDLPTFKPNPDVSAEQLIVGYRDLIERAHARGIKVVGATILPFKGADYHNERAEAKREAVNHWIRTSGAFDAVADFAAALASPTDAQLLNPAYDYGDFKHPNDAGYRVMAEAIDIDAL